MSPPGANLTKSAMPALSEATDIDAHDSTRTSRDTRANWRLFSFDVRGLHYRPPPLDLDLRDTPPKRGVV
jgi:hypothetical protein